MYLLGGTEEIRVNVEQTVPGQECAYCEVFWLRSGEQLSPLTSIWTIKAIIAYHETKFRKKRGDHL